MFKWNISSKMLRKVSTFSDKCHMSVKNCKIKVRRTAKIHIVLVKARGLAKLNSNGKSSDPYCKIALGKETVKSKMISKCTNPIWNEAFDFNWYSEFNKELHITVWNKNYWDLPMDDRMGNIDIDLSTLEPEKTYQIWRRLANGQGKIFFLLTISGTTSKQSETNIEFMNDKLESIKQHWMEKLNAKSNTSTVGYLMVKVLEARNLANTDIIGRSDPFCVVRLNNDRFVTQTDCNNLSPYWGKVFQFTNVTDICDILEITVYDENYDHKYDLLGRLKIPLLRIENDKKKWYSLKGKFLRFYAKGGQPRILLEMYFIYNKPLSLLNIIKSPRQEIFHQEMPKKLNSPTRSANRIKSVTTNYIDISKIIALFKRNKPEKRRSFMGLYSIILISIYLFELWMIPLGLAIPFAINIIVADDRSRSNTSYDELENDEDEDKIEEEIGQDDIDEACKSVPWLTSVNERMRQMQEMKFSVQLGLDMLANELESIQNLYNFSCPVLSWIALSGLILMTILLKYISIRHLLMALIIKKMVWSLLNWNEFGMIDIVSFMSRVPDNEELEDYHELKLIVNDLQTPKNGNYNHSLRLSESPTSQIAVTDAIENDKAKVKQSAATNGTETSDKQNQNPSDRKRVRTSMEGMRGIICAIAHIQDKDD